MRRWTLTVGDSAEVLRGLPDCSADALVCDPPAGISFMNKAWDGDKGGRDQWIDWLAGILREALRVMKPGAHGLVWALPRTSHWTGMACELAGFEVRDRVAHLHGTGFPKSMNISKAIDAMAGHKRGSDYEPNNLNNTHGDGFGGGRTTRQDPAVPDLAKQWDGWGTALKPACEDWWLVRRPIAGTVAGNVARWGTGGLNVDGCRVEAQGRPLIESRSDASVTAYGDGLNGSRHAGTTDQGRWPANVVMSHEPECVPTQCAPTCPAAMLDEQSGETTAPVTVTRGVQRSGVSGLAQLGRMDDVPCFGDTGGASRFLFRATPDTRCALCSLRYDESAGIPTPWIACGADGHSSQNTRGSGSAAEVAPPRGRPDNAGKLERSPLSARSAATRLRDTPATTKSIAPPNAATSLAASLSQCANDAGLGVCGKCVTVIAHALAGPAHRATEALHHGLGFMPEHKRQTLIPNLASVAAIRENTDTTTTIHALKMWCGSALHAIASITAEKITASCQSRYAYQPKPDRAERDAGCEHLPALTGGEATGREDDSAGTQNPRAGAGRTGGAHNVHPTVKSIDLMRYLCRLITPPGGLVLDPFAGSGSTGCAALLEGFRFHGIELDTAHACIAANRLMFWENRQVRTDGRAGGVKSKRVDQLTFF